MMPLLVRNPARLARMSTSRLRSYLACTRTCFVSRRTVSMLWLSTSGAASSTTCRFSQFPWKSPMSVSNLVSGERRRTARMVFAQMSAPPSSRSSRSTQVITQCFTPISSTLRATRAGSKGSTASGRPVATEQKPQLRVHTLPRIMNVAVPAPQHSPMFGQLPLWQMVWSLCSPTMPATFLKFSPVGSFTRSQSGLRVRSLTSMIDSLISPVACRAERRCRIRRRTACSPRHRARP